MDSKETKNIWIVVVVIALIAGAYYFGTASKNQTGVTDNTQDTNTLTPTQETATQQNQVAPVVTIKPKVTVPQNTYTNFELSENPKYLFSKDFNPNKAKVFGVGIGDLRSNITSIVPQQEYGSWVRTTNSTAYRIVNGIVVEIALNNDGIANLFRTDEIIIKFGQSDQTKTTGNPPYTTTTYYYVNRGLVVYDYGSSGIKVNIIGN